MNPESYMKYFENQLISPLCKENVPRPAKYIHSQFRNMVMSPQFPCSGAKTAFNGGTYRFGVFQRMGDKDSTLELGNALRAFLHERPSIDGEFNTFIASFLEKPSIAEKSFVDVLWDQLQLLHEIDSSDWDSAVDSDPESPQFSFSFEGTAFFVIGMHAESPRWARRFGWPTLVFNPHDQFEMLREKGDFERFRDIVRRRDQQLQGFHNPVLDDYGKSSEAFQYSGERPSKEWKCPFHHKNKK